MAMLKVVNTNYQSVNDVARLVYYVMNPNKRYNNIYGSQLLYLYQDTRDTARQILNVNAFYGKTQGSIVRHFIISYPYYNEVITPQTITHAVHQLILMELQGYPCIFAVHENTDYSHIHLVVGTVNLYSGMKFPVKKETYLTMADTLQLNTSYRMQNGRIRYIPYEVIYGEKPLTAMY